MPVFIDGAPTPWRRRGLHRPRRRDLYAMQLVQAWDQRFARCYAATQQG